MKGLDDGPDGLNDEAFDAALAAPAKPKRKKSTSPTQRTLAECRKRGWIAGVVERWNPHVKIRQDLFGVIDIVVIVPAYIGQHPASDHGGDGICAACSAPAAILAIQCGINKSGEHAAHRAKILAEPRAKAWVDAGGRLELWSWAKQGDRGKAKRWTLRVETYEQMRAASEATSP